jgi:ElaB/YqjD/DUF883 family membrane-anchored ribosome-binding protein
MTGNSNAARETAKEAREAMQDSRKAASEASDNIQADLDALREDVADLAGKLGAILSGRGNAAWTHAKSGVEDTISDLEKKVREAGGGLSETINGAIETRPYTTLALAAGLGFIFGATWRR